jgi:hypothetical protein
LDLAGAECHRCQLKAKPNQSNILRSGKTIPPSPPSKGGDRNQVQSPPFEGGFRGIAFSQNVDSTAPSALS